MQFMDALNVGSIYQNVAFYCVIMVLPCLNFNLIQSKNSQRVTS
ncbi:MAG: hypothetical protein JWP78_1580 [Mucilaginibacter sp.]|nr:hypothetical protein [Mucilaginibacter sp.]